MGACLLVLCLVQDPSLDEILKEFDRGGDSVLLEEQIRSLSEDLVPDMARRVVEDLGQGPMSAADRVMLDALARSEDPGAIRVLNEALDNSTLSASNRLGLAEALNGVAGVDRRDAMAEIAGGNASALDRLQALDMLRQDGDPRVAKLSQQILPQIPREALSSDNVREQVVLLARKGSKEAEELLWDTATDASLPAETRLAVAEDLRRLGNVSQVDRLLESFTGLRPTKTKPTTGAADHNRAVAVAGAEAPKELVVDEPAAASRRSRPRGKSGVKPRTKSGGLTALERNLIILSITIILGAVLVLSRRPS